MSGKAAKVVITEKQQAVLQRIVDSPTASVRLVQRSQVILLAFERRRTEEISRIVGLHRRQIGLWRKRWREAFERLVSVEVSERPPAAGAGNRGPIGMRPGRGGILPSGQGLRIALWSGMLLWPPSILHHRAMASTERLGRWVTFNEFWQRVDTASRCTAYALSLGKKVIDGEKPSES